MIELCGVVDSKVRDGLLRAEDLALALAVKMCQTSEMTKEEKRQIETTKGSGSTEEAVTALVDAVSGSTRSVRARQPAAAGESARQPYRAGPGAAGVWAGSTAAA